MTKKKLERKRFISVSEESQGRNLETGMDAEAMEERYLLAYYFWVLHFFLMYPRAIYS